MEGKKQFEDKQISLLNQLKVHQGDQSASAPHAPARSTSTISDATTSEQQKRREKELLAKALYHRKQKKELEDIHLNVLLVEDYYDDRKNAVGIIEKCFPNIDIYAAGTVQGAMEELADHDMDLLLLDIRLPDGTAFDLIKAIRSISQYRFVHVVFITGEDYDPLETFSKYHCYAFITKPYFKETLISQLAPIIEALKKERLEGRVPVRHKARIFNTIDGEAIIKVDDILYAELSGRDMIIHTDEDKYAVRRMSIKTFLDYIDDPDFVRCHESFAVNMRKVVKLEATGHRDYIAVTVNGDRGCSVSQRNYCKMKKLFDEECMKRNNGSDV